MISSTHVSQHGAGSLRKNAFRLRGLKYGHASGPGAARSVLLCCCLAGLLHVHPLACLAQSPTDAADNQTLPVTFISLKPGSTIGDSNLQLHADKTLNFSIKGETLPDPRGTWSQKKNRFTARVDFTVDRRTSFHYRLTFDGYRLMSAYAGRAHLYEYDQNGRLMQKIGFLFYAVPPKFFTAQQHTEENGAQ
jgi:hypothetical protein